MTLTQQLIAVATAYANAEKVGPSVVSWRVFGDSKKLGAIMTGADIQTKRFERTMEWFVANWPDGGTWPADIPVPPAPQARLPRTRKARAA